MFAIDSLEKKLDFCILQGSHYFKSYVCRYVYLSIQSCKDDIMFVIDSIEKLDFCILQGSHCFNSYVCRYVYLWIQSCK